MDKTREGFWAPTELSRNLYQAFPTDVETRLNRLLKHLKHVPTMFDPKIEDESAATSHMKAPVSTQQENEYFKNMNMKLSRSCADLSSQLINSAVHFFWIHHYWNHSLHRIE